MGDGDFDSPAIINFEKNKNGTVTMSDTNSLLYPVVGPWVGTGIDDRLSDIFMSMCHENYLNSNFVQLSDVRFHQWFNHSTQTAFPSLIDYITYLKGQSINSISTYSSLGISYDYISDEYITLFKGMIRFLEYIHSLGESLKNPRELRVGNNFSVLNGVIKVCNIDVRKANNSTRHLDYKEMGRIMKEILRGKYSSSKDDASSMEDEEMPPIPYDFSELLKAMDGYKEQICRQNWHKLENKITGGQTIGSGDLISKHFAILTHHERIHFMMDSINKSGYVPVMQRFSYRDAVQKIEVERGWAKRFAASYVPRAFELIFVAAAAHPQKETEEKGKAARLIPGDLDTVKYISEQYHDGSDPSDSDFKVKIGFLRCCRNIVTHMADSVEMVQGRSSSFSEREIDHMLSQAFVKEITDFQAALFEKELLHVFLDLSARFKISSSSSS